MTKTELQQLIKEAVQELRESDDSLSAISQGISTSTMTGRSWSKLIDAFRDTVKEVADFNSMYSSKIHGPQPNTAMAMQKLREIALLLTEIRPVILGMSDIEKKDF